jgi:hypothetical protein
MGSATYQRMDENPIPPPDQGEVRWGWFESSIFGADAKDGREMRRDKSAGSIAGSG